MDLIQFTLETLANFAPKDETNNEIDDSFYPSIALEQLTPSQIFATVSKTVQFHEQTATNVNRFDILQDLGSVIIDDNADESLLCIRLALVVEVISLFGRKEETSDADNAKIETAFANDLQSIFSEALKAIPQNINNSSAEPTIPFYSNFAAICFAKLILLGRLDPCSFLATLSTPPENFDGEDLLSSSFTTAIEILSQVVLQQTETSEKYFTFLLNEILTVAIKTIVSLSTKNREIISSVDHSEIIKQVSRKILFPLLEITSIKNQRKEDLLENVKILSNAALRSISTSSSLASAFQLSEVMMLIASLFDIFIANNNNGTVDLRSETFLWDLILVCLQRTSSFNEDPSVKTNVHNLAIYLLKRIVSTTGGKDVNLQVTTTTNNNSKSNNNANAKKQPKQTASTNNNNNNNSGTQFFDSEKRFYWCASQTDQYLSHWSQFFIIFESLNEYSTHLCDPATQSLKQLWEGSCVGSCFIEAVLFKAITHANAGVRRLALSLVWSFDPERVSNELSLDFMTRTLLLGAGDPRLCQEIDRTVAFSPNSCNSGTSPVGGQEASEVVGNSQPVLATVARLSNFYCSLVSIFLNKKEDSLRSFLSGMIKAASSTTETTNFCLSIFCRIFRDIAHHLKGNHNSTQDILTPSICDALSKLLLDAVHSRRPTWLEARFVGLICDALVTFQISPQNEELRYAVIRTLTVAGPLAEAGGKSQAPVDSVGIVLPIGSAVPVPLLKKLVRESSANLVNDNKIASKLLVDYLQSSSSSSSVLDVPKVKSLCFQIALANQEAPVVAAACEILSSLDQRTAISPSVVAKAAAIYSEICTYDSSEVSSLFLNEERSSNHNFAQFCNCSSLIRSLTSFASRMMSLGTDLLSQSESCSNSAFLMAIHSADAWDALSAAIFWSVKFGVSTTQQRHQKETLVHFEALWQTCLQLIDLVQNRVFKTESNNSTTNQQQLKMILQRNVIRFVQSAAAGIAISQVSSSASATPVLPPAIALELLKACCERVTPLRTSVDSITELSSGLTWSSICAQHYRATWSASLVFLTHCSSSLSPQQLLQFGARFLEEMDCCAANNLSCIVDLVGFVLSNLKPVAGAREFALKAAKTIRDRMVDGYRKERIRCLPTFCFAVCRCEVLGNTSDNSDDLLDLLLPLLSEDEEAAQRVPYLVAQAVAERSLSLFFESSWISTKELLLHLCVFLNTTINDPDETEACYSAMEPVLRSTSALDILSRRVYPPTTRMVSLARASALSALHHHAASSPEKAQWIISTLLDWFEDIPEIAGKDVNQTCMVNSSVFRNRLRLWQTVTSLAGYIKSNNNWWATTVDRILKRSLLTVNPASIRRLIEGFCYAGFCIAPEETIPILIDVSRNFETRPYIISSYLQLASMILLNDINSAFLASSEVTHKALVSILVLYCSSHQHVLRLVCGLALAEIFPSSVPVENVAACIREFHPHNNLTVHYVTSHPECLKFLERYQEVTGFRTIFWQNTNLIFCVQRQEGSNQWLHDSMPAEFFRRISRCEDELRSFLSSLSVFDFYRGMNLGRSVDEVWKGVFETQLRYLPTVSSESDLYIDYNEILLAIKNASSNTPLLLSATDANPTSTNDDSATTQHQNRNVVQNLQRKTVPWWQTSVHRSLNELTSASSSRTATAAKDRQQLIIVASLLDNPVNIAGLFRVSEIFAAQKIIIPDKKVLTHPHFIAAARSAELWFPHETVSPSNLPEFFAAQKEKGYTICAIEQTADSVSIQDYKFPEKAVLVLGNEGQGMPANLLPYMNVCIEIPQFGLIRSLNVHTTGSIVIYEFTKQHKLGGSKA